MPDDRLSSNSDASPLILYGNLRRVALVFTAFCWTILVAMSLGTVALLSNRDFLQAGIVAAAVPPIAISLVLVARQQFERAAIFLAAVLFTLLTVLATSDLGIHNISNLGFPAVLIVSSLVIRRRTLVLITAAALACVAWLVFGELAGAFHPSANVTSVPGDFISVGAILVATTIMVRLLTEALYASNSEVQQELVERQRVEQRLEHDSLHDALTGLPNRVLFSDRLAQQFETARRRPGARFAVLFVDLDRFKVVNDSLGHQVGDQMLITAAQRLANGTRPEDTVARLGGDEFGVLLSDLTDSSDAIRVANRMQQSLTATSLIATLDRVSTASIGIAIYHGRYESPEGLLRDADTAMYRAKAQGGGQYEIFDESMYTSAVALLSLEADLKRAVENEEWRIVYQPILALHDAKVVGVEALVRWRHPQRGLLAPAEFIEVAEGTGLIVPMGAWVLRTACRQAQAWRAAKQPNLWVSVNISGRQFQDQNLVTLISEALRDSGLPGEGLRLEITEGVAMKDFAYSAVVLNRLGELGIQTWLDDFGNGYSSLGYLNRFPIRTIKIDRSFITGVPADPKNSAIIEAITSLGHALGLGVVAEGVEYAEQTAFLKAVGCDQMQGYLLGRPLEAAALEATL